jgi:hypothetical protein
VYKCIVVKIRELWNGKLPFRSREINWYGSIVDSAAECGKVSSEDFSESKDIL